MNKIVAILKNPWFTRCYLLILIVWMLVLFYSHRGDFLSIIREAKRSMILSAMATYFIVVGVINPFIHRIGYKEIGSNISFWQAFRIYHLSRIGNYLPGRIWFATNYYIFSKKMDIDSKKIARNFLALNVLLFLVGSLCSLPIISVLNPAAQKLLIFFPLLMFAIIHPRLFSKITSFFFRDKAEKNFRYIFLAKIGALYFITYILLGVLLFFCVMAFTATDISNFPLIVAASASSLIIGLLAIFAPAGIGVSEGVNTAILTQIIPLNITLIVVLTLRMVSVLIDLICALISAVSVAREEKAVTQNVA